MIFGNRSILAVEFELDQDYKDSWLFGKFCYWIRGRRVGDYELGTSLRDVLFSLDTLIRDSSNRNHEELFGLSRNELFKRLDETLFGLEITQYEEVAVKEAWARFNVVLPVDIFNGCKVYLVESLELSRILFRNFNEKEIQEERFEKGLFDEIIFKAHRELVKLYDSTIDN